MQHTRSRSESSCLFNRLTVWLGVMGTNVGKLTFLVFPPSRFGLEDVSSPWGKKKFGLSYTEDEHNVGVK